MGRAHSGAIPAYTRLDAGIAWQATERLLWRIGVQNALDPQHAEFLRRTGAQPEIGRAMYGQVTVR